MSAYLFYIALLGLLIFVLGFAVSLTRMKSATNISHSTNPEDFLHKVVRAHGNTIEYAPFLALLIYVLGQQNQPGWVNWSMGFVVFFRYLIVAGLLFPKTMGKPNLLRFLGAAGTYVTGTLLVIALFMMAMSR